MSYTVENTKELFLVTLKYNTTTHLIMSKREVQEQIKCPITIKSIQKLEFTAVEKIPKKYFLPKHWEKINPRTVTYGIYKAIAEAEEKE